MAKESDGAAFGMDANAVAVPVLPDGGDGGPHRHLGEVPEAAQGLPRPGRPSVPIAARSGCVGRRIRRRCRSRGSVLGAVRRRFFNRDQVRLGELFLLLKDSGCNLLPRNNEGNKNGEAIVPADTFAAEGDIVDGDMDWGGNRIKEKGFRPGWTKALLEELQCLLPARILLHVIVLRFPAKLGREFLIAAVDPGDIRAIERAIGAFIGREWEGEELVPAKTEAIEVATPFKTP